MSYIGRSSDGFGLLNKYRWVASGGETSISPSLTDSNGNQLRFTDKNLVHLFLNGVKLDQTDYNLDTANTISGLTALSASDILEAHVYDTFSIATLDTVPTSGGTFTGNVNVSSTADNGPIISLVSNDHSDAANWATEGTISFKADNDANEETEFANIKLVTADVTDGSENGRLRVSLLGGGGNPVNSYNLAKDKLFLEDDNHVIRWNNTKGTNYEIELGTTTPTATRSITLPDADGTVITTGNSDTPTTTTSSSDADFVLVDDGGTMKKITPTNLGIGGGGVTVQDEGSALSTTATTLDFVGAGVTASGTGATKTITISSGGGSPAADDITTGDAAVNLATTTGNINIDPQANNTYVEIKGNNAGGTLQLNCENNSHGVKIQSPDHSAGQSYTLKLPDNQVAANKILKVKSITGSGATAVGQLEFADESGGSAADDITTGDAAVTLATTSGNITIDAQQSDSDIIFKGTDGGSDTTFLTLDGSDAGSAIFNHDIKMPTGGKIMPVNSGDHLELDSYEGIKLWSRDTDGVAIEYSYGSYWTPVLKFNRRSFGSNPQGVGRIEFNGRKRDNGGGNEADQQYGYIQVQSTDTDTGEASGKMVFNLARDDGSKNVMTLDTNRVDLPHDGAIILGTDIDIGWQGGNASGHITYLSCAHGNPSSMSDDVTIVLPSVDGTVITTGNLSAINSLSTLYADLSIKTGTGGILKLQTSDSSVVDGNTVGAIEFNAPDESNGGIATQLAASIVAEADRSDTNTHFNSSQNPTDLVFKLGETGTATEKVRFTHEGHIGVGTTTPTSPLGANYSALDINSGVWGGTINFSGNSGGYIGNRHSGNGGLGYYSASGQGHDFHVNGNTTPILNINSNGSVGIGSNVTTSDLNIGKGLNSNYTGIQFTSPNTATGTIIYFGDSTDNDYSSITSFASGAGESGRMRFVVATYESMNIYDTGHKWMKANAASGTSMVIDNDASTNPFGLAIRFNNNSNDNNSTYFLRGQDSTAVRFSIYSDGDIYNHDGTYTQISDERIKTNITDAKSQWDDIKAIRFVNYEKKDDVAVYGEGKKKELGVVAQELEKVCPNLVKEYEPDHGQIKYTPEFGTLYEDGDEIPEDKQVGDVKEVKSKVKGIKQSILYMKAVKALQEAMTRIETLEAKVKALEEA